MDRLFELMMSKVKAFTGFSDVDWWIDSNVCDDPNHSSYLQSRSSCDDPDCVIVFVHDE